MIKKGKPVEYSHVAIKDNLDINVLACKNRMFLVKSLIRITESTIKGKVDFSHAILKALSSLLIHSSTMMSILRKTEVEMYAVFSNAQFKGSGLRGCSDYFRCFFRKSHFQPSGKFSRDLAGEPSYFQKHNSAVLLTLVKPSLERMPISLGLYSMDTLISKNPNSLKIPVLEEPSSVGRAFHKAQFGWDVTFRGALFSMDVDFR
jgi:hypothetical protein